MSCRRGVPDRCSRLNSLAEKVRELWERCANAIKSINGINPDGANNFDILPGAGIQVNPRANGIEIVNTGALPPTIDSVETINQIAPDANHDFTITAGSGVQINAGTNGIEIENTSQGAIYTGVSPIDVNASNEISIKDFTLHNSNNWNIFEADHKTTTDLLFTITDSSWNHYDMVFIPKGTITNATYISLPTASIGTSRTDIGAMSFLLTNILSSGGSIYLEDNYIRYSEPSGSGISQYVKLEKLTTTRTYTKNQFVKLYYR